ncbi:uncharacterized protein (TIGR03086 family) [Marmoricola sp. OAE513]|uniref:TIGR03086 family metal-binding protein n=1 Tax=Marmoricola sp. OAE513 TaxID=2817894 RepID=UPI001AE61158
MDLLDLYASASEWTLGKATGAAVRLDALTPCEGWDVGTLMNHMLQTQQYFVGSALGQKVAPPAGEPPQLLSDDPIDDFLRAREEMLRVFGTPGVIERTGPALGIAFADQLLHGWDLAKSMGQSGAMPGDLAETAYGLVHGSFTDEQRQGVFAPEIAVPAGASPQDKLLAYAGRDPALNLLA